MANKVSFELPVIVRKRMVNIGDVDAVLRVDGETLSIFTIEKELVNVQRSEMTLSPAGTHWRLKTPRGKFYIRIAGEGELSESTLAMLALAAGASVAAGRATTVVAALALPQVTMNVLDKSLSEARNNDGWIQLEEWARSSGVVTDDAEASQFRFGFYLLLPLHVGLAFICGVLIVLPMFIGAGRGFALQGLLVAFPLGLLGIRGSRELWASLMTCYKSRSLSEFLSNWAAEDKWVRSNRQWWLKVGAIYAVVAAISQLSLHLILN